MLVLVANERNRLPNFWWLAVAIIGQIEKFLKEFSFSCIRSFNILAFSCRLLVKWLRTKTECSQECVQFHREAILRVPRNEKLLPHEQGAGVLSKKPTGVEKGDGG